MPDVLRFSAPGVVDVVDLPSPEVTSDSVRVRTIASGISAGTEMSAYRGTNPYLHDTWDTERHLFLPADNPNELAYPLDGWGYSEVGEVVEIGPLSGQNAEADALQVGDIVWGIWGHRREAVVEVDKVAGHQVPGGVKPDMATFDRVAAVALNAVLNTELGLGSTVAIVGQGVIGLLATRFAKLSGARVLAIDGVETRLDVAREMGADAVLTPSDTTALDARKCMGVADGLDCAIDLSGSYPGLQSAISLVGPDGIVSAAGFYQGTGQMTLGYEFHHNRVDLRCSQIGAVARNLLPRWTRERLHRCAAELLFENSDLVSKLITHRFDLADAAEAYALVDGHPRDILQVILEMK